MQYLRLTSSLLIAAALLFTGCDSSLSPTSTSERATSQATSTNSNSANQGPRGGSAPSSAKTVYNTFEIKKSLQDIKWFLPWEGNGINEVGDHIRFAEEKPNLGTVTIGLSSRTPYSKWSDSYPASGYEHPFTLNLYEVDKSGETPAVGDLIASKTKTATVPWRPKGNQSPKCQEAGGGWGSLCRGGLQFTVTFDMSGVEGTDNLPDEIIYGIAFNTEKSGYSPIGEAGPYNFLSTQTNIVEAEMGRGNEDEENIAVPPDPGTNVEAAIFRAYTGGTFERLPVDPCPIEFLNFCTTRSGDPVGITQSVKFDMERP